MQDPQRAIFIPVLVPLGTTVTASRLTYGTCALMAINVLFFLVGLSSETFADHLAFFMHDRWYRYATYAFIHEPTVMGMGHLVFNMLFLWVFASPLESRIGWWRLIALYLICAVAGSVAWVLFQGVPKEPMLGSSAAVWGIVAAYLVLWPSSSVKFFFTVLLIYTPLYARAWKMWAIVFAALYHLFLGGMALLAWWMDFKLLIDIAWSAHAAGILMGITLTAAALAVKGGAHPESPQEDGPEPEHDQPAFQKKPRPALMPEDKPARKPAQPKAKPAAPAPPKWMPLHEAVILGDNPLAIRLWLGEMKPELNASLMPGPQLDLARMLARDGKAEDAIEALDRLLRVHPRCELAAVAKLELAKLLADHGRDPQIIAALLDEIETSNPSVDILQDVEELRERLSRPQTHAPAAAPKTEIDQMVDLPNIDEIPEPLANAPAASVLFGDPEDTDAFGIRIEKDAPAQAKPAYDDTTPPADVSKELALFADPEDEPQQIDNDAFKPRPVTLKNDPAQKTNDDPFFNRQSILPHFDEYKGERVVDESFEPGAVQGFKQPRPAYVSLEPLGELEKTHVPTPETFIGDITQFPYKPDSDDTQELPLVLRPTMRYAALLTPGRPVDIQLVCSTLAPMLGLGPETTHHALLRRRGILLDDMLAAEAEALARKLSTAGQSVSLVAMDKTLDFGAPLDVMTYHDEGVAGRFSVAGQALVCRWSRAVCFAAGLVRLEPTAPGRAVLDLFFSQPRVHLRLWESTMAYPDRINATAKVLETIYPPVAGEFNRMPLRRDWCFRATATEISDHGKYAICTRSLSEWLETAAPLPSSHFWSLIEYDNFLRWHLMAYHAPKKVYG